MEQVTDYQHGQEPATAATFSQVFSLAGKLALITGGGSGIGFDIARCMVEAGATVIITGRREQPLQDAVASLTAGRSTPSAYYVVN
ncbi:MAG: short-chain dehydrogenase/reductase, partial [Spirosoma sp.]|nr:short-chain dehydrogenase/reductase [Spirosoma sp.]